MIQDYGIMEIHTVDQNLAGTYYLQLKVVYDNEHSSKIGFTIEILACMSVQEDSTTSLTESYTLGTSELEIEIESLNPNCFDSVFMLAESTKLDLPSFIKFEATEQSMSLTV